MQNNEYLAQEALKYLEIAQKFEEEGKTEEAIENYQLAVDYLKESGYMIHRISDLYNRIEDLKSFKQEQKLFLHKQRSVQIEKFQDQAFVLIDRANELETSYHERASRYGFEPRYQPGKSRNICARYRHR